MWFSEKWEPRIDVEEWQKAERLAKQDANFGVDSSLKEKEPNPTIERTEDDKESKNKLSTNKNNTEVGTRWIDYTNLAEKARGIQKEGVKEQQNNEAVAEKNLIEWASLSWP